MCTCESGKKNKIQTNIIFNDGKETSYLRVISYKIYKIRDFKPIIGLYVSDKIREKYVSNKNKNIQPETYVRISSLERVFFLYYEYNCKKCNHLEF